MKKVQKYLEENGRKDEVDAFKAGAQKAVKELLGKFKDLRFYQGNFCCLCLLPCYLRGDRRQKLW